MDGLMITLRLVHILLGVIWAGWGIALALFINPAVGIAGPAGGQFMQALAGKTNLVKVMTIAPILVIITGIWMLWVVSGGFNTAWMMSTHGMTLLIGSTLGIVAAIYGLGFVRPLAMQMGQLGAKIAASGAPPTPEMQAEMGALRQKLLVGGKVVAVLLGATVLLMAAARYVY